MKSTTDYVLRVEGSTICNQRCVFCPRERFRLTNMIMPWKAYTEIIDALDDLKIKVEFINFSGMGEPFTDPYIIDRAKYGRKISDRFECYTNGSLLDERMMRRVNEVFTRVYFSIHGRTPQEYELFTGNKFKVMKERLLMAKEILGDKLLLTNNPDGNLGRKYLGVEPLPEQHPMHHFGDEQLKASMIAKGVVPEMPEQKYCELTSFLMLRIDGSWGSCCNDWNNDNSPVDNRFPRCEKCISYKHYLDLRSHGEIKSFSRFLKTIAEKVDDNRKWRSP